MFCAKVCDIVLIIVTKFFYMGQKPYICDEFRVLRISSHPKLGRNMAKISDVFYRFNVQWLHILMIPFTFAVIVLVYRPFDLDDFFNMNRGLYAFNLTMITCIILVVLLITRLIFYALRGKMSLSTGWYVFWCSIEVVIIAHFMTLYMWLMLRHTVPYLEVLGHSFYCLTLILLLPYTIISLVLQMNEKRFSPEYIENQRIRFCDENGNLKLLVNASNVLYITAEENYIKIFYLEKDKVMTYVLRSTMKSLEKLCQSKGLVRCHRSFFINSKHVRSLRKEKEGYIIAELDSPDKQHIPVSATYYDSLAAML